MTSQRPPHSGFAIALFGRRGTAVRYRCLAHQFGLQTSRAIRLDATLRSPCNCVLIVFQAYTNIHPGAAGGAS